MPTHHFVPKFAQTLHASPRAQANALKALAMTHEEMIEKEWAPRAVAALRLGAEWAGERWNPDVAGAGVQEAAVAKHYARMAEQLRNAKK